MKHYIYIYSGFICLGGFICLYKFNLGISDERVAQWAARGIGCGRCGVRDPHEFEFLHFLFCHLLTQTQTN